MLFEKRESDGIWDFWRREADRVHLIVLGCTSKSKAQRRLFHPLRFASGLSFYGVKGGGGKCPGRAPASKTHSFPLLPDSHRQKLRISVISLRS